MQMPPGKIAILSSFLHHASGFGGITPWLVNLANGFLEKGHPVDILVNAAKHTPLYYEPIDERIPIINLGYHKLTAIGALRRYLKKNRPDVLLAAGYRYNNMAVLAHLTTGRPSKCFLSVHENITSGSQKLKNWKGWLRFALIRRLYGMAKGVVAVSDGVARDLVDNFGLPAENVGVIYNPIVNPRIEALAAEEPEHPWLKNKQMPVVLGVGRLEPQKAFDQLIRAFSKLIGHTPSKLIIIGEGAERKNLEQLIQTLELHDQVALPGFAANPFAYMQKADLFVLSSGWEGFGNVLAEALATGTPVVSTDCPSGPAEILNQGEFGPLVPVGDTDALAAAMKSVLENPPEREKLINRGYRYDVASSVAEYLDYFNAP